MNIYRHIFRAQCPANGRTVEYSLSIETRSLIMVEALQDVTAAQKGYHEEIADDLYRRFGGRQVITAHHHGTDVETIRP